MKREKTPAEYYRDREAEYRYLCDKFRIKPHSGGPTLDEMRRQANLEARLSSTKTKVKEEQ